MKTYETEKNNIPEGATHYQDEENGVMVFAFFKNSDGFSYYFAPGHENKWVKLDDPSEMLRDCVKPIPQTKEVEWEIGELLEFMGEPCVFIGMSEGLPVVRYKNNADNALSGTIDVITAVDMLSKPETEAERVEREELEAAYDLYCEWCLGMSYPKFTFTQFKETKDDKKGMLAIVRKTGYRKESE